MARKSLNDQLHDSKDLPKIVDIKDPDGIRKNGGPRLLIAPAIAYDEMMRKVPEGKVVTSDQIRRVMAEKSGADNTCPLTAGIFINLVAKASEERGVDMTPYWRTLKKDGELNEKYPGGIETQKQKLEAEGHKVVSRGKKYFVENFERVAEPLA